MKQVVFAITLLITLGIFSITLYRIIGFFKLTASGFPIRDLGRRISIMLEVAIGQTKIFRQPVIGLFHALVFWGFCVILIGSIEMIIDGLAGTDRILSFLGPVYDILMASGDIFALIVALCILIFLGRRLLLHIARFEGIEMRRKSHLDAAIALSLIFLLMISLLGINIFYIAHANVFENEMVGSYPVSSLIAPLFINLSPSGLHMAFEVSWWSHILLIFLFANILPYSKHFHVFMSVPNVFLSRLEPLGKLTNMDSITKEVKMMLYPEQIKEDIMDTAPPARFGVRDAEDSHWKNYFDALSCTECGRCTAVCPANITGKKLSPRKIFMDLRARMKEKGPGMIKNGRDWSDGKSLVRDYISEEELWACTTCNACAMECPININHPTLIVDMRRYLVLEEASAPGMIKSMFNNIENNGAPWQFSSDDRLEWADNLTMNTKQKI